MNNYYYNELTDKQAKFWMVTGDKNSPTVRHTTFESARAESQRLAKANPGTKFYVLEATAGYVSEGLTRIL